MIRKMTPPSKPASLVVSPNIGGCGAFPGGNGGGCGGGGDGAGGLGAPHELARRGPQSAQSVPHAHAWYSEPWPPSKLRPRSSQSPSEA